MESDEDISFLIKPRSPLASKESSQFKISDSLFSLSRFDGPCPSPEDVSDFTKNIIICILNECMNELSILRSINLQNDLGPNPNKLTTYCSIEDRYMGQENHAECRINSTDNNFDKLAKDINKLYVILKCTCQEIKKCGNYKVLDDAVKITNEMHREEVQLLRHEEEKEKVIEDLKNLYEEERLENIRTIEETDAKIQKLRYQGEDIYIYGQHEVVYFDKWEKARLEQNEMKCKEKENQYLTIITNMDEKISLEIRCHNELVNYLEESKNDYLEEIQYWMKRYDEGLEQRDGDIVNFKSELERITEERKILMQKYEQRAAAIRDWKEYSRIKAEKENQRIKEVMAATTIQCWWRRVMVRRKLGPYRKKKKGAQDWSSPPEFFVSAMDASYVPNNPQFGLQFECNWSGPAAVQQVSSCTDDLSSCWSDEMGSFSLPLDLEPLPSLFNISPCGNGMTNAGYKTEPNFQNQNSFVFRDQKQPSSDVADVLLSLKHAVVHPGQSPTDKYDSQQHAYYPQMLLSPGGYSATGICDQNFGIPQQTPLFPSMSVNVSMNMTMHGYHPNAGYSSDISCPQVQWTANTQNPSQATYQSQGLLSPSYGGTYSFTADFRPPQDASPILSSSAPYKPLPMSFASPRRRPSYNMLDEESQKPNVCRICGKSYARPSTLKTHLRTHSGEKPFRCADCNKSFSQAANLTAHVRTHSGEKPFRCPVCDRRFSQSSSVTTHMRTHSGERPYRCRLCKKAFSDSSTLTKHLRIHSGEKPYECKLCLLRFSQSGNLNRHMRVHGSANGLPP